MYSRRHASRRSHDSSSPGRMQSTQQRPAPAAGTPVRVVCVGGGYVALFLCRALRGAIRRGLVDVTVVSRDNFHTYHGFVAEMLVGRIQPGQIMTPARRIFAPARFHNAEVERIDVAEKTVTA